MSDNEALKLDKNSEKLQQKRNPSTLGEANSYELYKQEVLAWQDITDFTKEKQCVAIAFSLPDDDESKIREKVFSKLKLEDLKKEDGLASSITFLYKHKSILFTYFD